MAWTTGEVGLSFSGTQWVINAYPLTPAAFFALGGRPADIVGRRRIMVIGTLVFVISSVLCGSVPTGSYAQSRLVTFRAFHGLGAALMFPAALAVVIAVFPVERRGRALALFFGRSGALTAVGPLLRGRLTGRNWRAIFRVDVPVAVIALVLTAMAHIKNTSRRDRLDVPGAVLVAVGMGLSVLGFRQASTWGWGSAATGGCIVGGVLVLVMFCLFELRLRDPLVKLQPGRSAPPTHPCHRRPGRRDPAVEGRTAR